MADKDTGDEVICVHAVRHSLGGRHEPGSKKRVIACFGDDDGFTESILPLDC
jgi:hypothetical protein